MKKLLLTLTCVIAIAGAAFAQSSWSLTPSTSTLSGPTGTFTVTVALNTTASNVFNFDFFLGSNSAGADAFTITSVSSLQGVANSAGFPTFPDEFLAPTNAANPQNYGFAYTQYDPDDPDPNDANGDRSLNDLGLVYTSDKAVSGGAINLETITFSYNFASLAPGTSFTFMTTDGTTTSPGFNSTPYSDGGDTLIPTIQGSFTVTEVPEPSTWLAGIGAAGVIAFTILRRRATG